MFGENVTQCIDGRCPYGERVCCFECDCRISEYCAKRCDWTSCHVDLIRTKLEKGGAYVYESKGNHGSGRDPEGQGCK